MSAHIHEHCLYEASTVDERVELNRSPTGELVAVPVRFLAFNTAL